MVIVAMRVRFTIDHAFWWCCMVGVLLTPWIIGLPIFGFSLLVVAVSVVQRSSEGGRLWVRHNSHRRSLYCNVATNT
jgi:hypothetical protein